MNLKTKVKSLTLAALMASPSIQAGTEGFLNTVMGTINPSAEIQGPVYRPTTKIEDRYGDELAKILIQEAHKKAKRYLDQGNTQAYYAFMALALTVPNQEGLMVHFREVPADRDNCNDDRSTGSDIKSSKAKSQFRETLNKRTFFSRNKGFLVTCSKLRGEDSYRQLILGGSDGSDVGIMQLSALWHYEEFLKEEKFSSVRETIRYGLTYISRRFEDIRANRESGVVLRGSRDIAYDFTCFNNQSDKEFYKNIVKGAWAAYNGGPTQICRFALENNPHKGKDDGFEESLQKTMDLNKGRVFGYNKNLAIPLTPKMKEVVEEIISNIENQTNERTNITTIL